MDVQQNFYQNQNKEIPNIRLAVGLSQALP